MGLVGSFKMSGNSKLMTQTKVEQRVAGLAGSSSESLLIDGCIQCIEQCEQILEMVSSGGLCRHFAGQFFDCSSYSPYPRPLQQLLLWIAGRSNRLR